MAARRVNLPGAAELFRPTTPVAEASAGAGADHGRPQLRTAEARAARQRRDEKITVYISGEELLALEHARLRLRATHGLVADRGKVVRTAVAELLADFEENGERSTLVRRLNEA
ncbi:hypothetical protein [Allonocardiopsis opalescens]|uniref:Cobyrinic acid a,c-diamide synthase n=1 Tax=Allonocardiopsis opalescens TaxID=1144618 RepID=A0A2T0Q4A1_9ACTN|nr:hypothetical protein [Allonocardiopsis opalescens]PRX98648.1 hypothetical protein CLV72_104226 [Allonocardiopsis opalescens]